MSDSNIQHPHVLDEIEAYLTDGLSPHERAAFETHVANCPTCSAALAEARQSDATLRAMFGDARPSAGFEDRIIRKLRMAGAPRRRLIHPMVFRSAAAVAAAVLLTSAGVVVSSVAENGRTGIAWIDNRLPSVSDEKVASNLRQIGQAMQMYDRDGTSFGRAYFGDGIAADARAANRALASSARRDLGSVQAGSEFRGLADNKSKQVEELRRKLAESEKDQKWGEADRLNSQLRDADPSDLHAYYLAPELRDKATRSLALTQAPQEAQAGDTGRGVVAGKPVQHANGRVQFGADQSAVPAASTGLNTWNDNIYSFRPGDQLVQVYKAEGKASPYDNVDSVLSPLTDFDERSKDGAAGGRNLVATGARGDADVKQLAQNAPAPAPGAGPQQAGPQQPAPAPPPVTQSAATGRKVIRNGTMEFEVASFDDALLRVTKLVTDQGGFVATTDSEKLPNGKVKGTVTVRVPPEHLDTLVLTLRGIGDLKTQKISADDVTKHYTDLESELRAARAMEDRLLEIIKTGKGQIKDLLEAEKQLGVWRVKIEQLEGEKRYLDNLISLSTLALTLYERDIKTPASLQETEQVAMSLETDKVDEAYEKARAAISDAKGRIIQSELKQFDAGQFGATIQAALPPDAAEQVIARVRQLPGRIAHFTRDHRQTTQTGAASAAPISEVHREDVVLTMQIYNLANVAPRRVTSAQVAAASVEKAYHDLIDQVRTAGGRIVTSSLTKPDATQQTAELDVQVPSDKADPIQDALRAAGELMRQDSTENPDTANVTEAKRGFHVKIVSLAAVPARESQKIDLAAASVPDAFNAISDAVRAAQGRILQSNVDEQDRNNVTGTISFEVSRGNANAVLGAIGKSAQVLTRAVTRSSDTENTVDIKLHLALTLRSADSLPARQSMAARYEVSDVERAVDDLVNAATGAGGRRIGSGEMTTDRAGHTTAEVVVDVPLSKAQPILDQLERSGNRRSKQVSFDNTVPDGSLARARIDVTFSNSAASLGGEESTWDALRHGLAISGVGLRWSLRMLVIGLFFVAPWLLVLWILWRLVRWTRRRPATTA